MGGGGGSPLAEKIRQVVFESLPFAKKNLAEM